MFKKLNSVILTALGVIILTATVLLSVKSQLGYPQITALNSNDWTENGPLELSPERSRFALLYSLVENRSFQFTPEVARLATPDLGYKNGKFVSLFAPGTSILMIPGYVLGSKFDASHLGATLVISLFALFNTMLIWKLVIMLGGSKLSGFIASFIFITATPAFNYAGIIYQHHLSSFMLLSALSLSLMPVSLLRLGLILFIFTFSAIIDVPNAFFMLPIVIYCAWRLIKIELTKKMIKISFNPVYLISGLFALVPILIYFGINYASYGNAFQLSNTVTHIQALDEKGLPVIGRGADERARSDIANLESRKRSALNFFKARHLINGLYAFTVSPDRGVLIFTPIVILGVLGLFELYKKKPKFAQVLIGIIIINLLVYSMRSDPWGGWAFGSRYLIPSYAILSLTLGMALDVYRRKLLFILPVILLAGYSIYVNTSGALSTSANPPQVEVLGLEVLTNRQERFSFDRNIEYLQNGKSKSFIYKTFLKETISPWDYYRIVAGALSAIFLISILLLFTRKDL